MDAQTVWRGPLPQQTHKALPYPILRRLSSPRKAVPRLAASRCGRPSPRAGDAASAAGEG
jgi:hypothetical protein